MSTTNGVLSAGVQQIVDAGLLPSNLSADTLKGASASQVNSWANSTIASRQMNALLGMTDSTSLSSTAEDALLQEINPTSATKDSSTTDLLTAAVNNALTSSLNAAVSKFASPSGAATGNHVNVVG